MNAFIVQSEPSRAWYRYRTCVLVGPWRSRLAEAQGDAVRARQACFDEVEGFSWNVAGRIEIGRPVAEDEIVMGRTAY